MFGDLAGPGNQSIARDAFLASLDQLENCNFTAEQKELLVERLCCDGINFDGFSSMVDQYYRFVNDVAMTTELHIKDSTTLKKVKAGDVLEVIGGPATDEALGVKRIKGRVVS